MPPTPSLTEPRSTNTGTPGELFAQTAALISATFYGPPVIFVLGPWLLLALLLAGPFVLILTVLLVMALAVALLAVLAAVIASPYLLVRHLHGDGMGRRQPRELLHLFRKHRVSSGRLGSLQPKGVS